MEQQGPGSPAEGTATDPSPAEGQGDQAPTQQISGSSPTLLHQLLVALLRGKHALFCALLPSASPADLAAVTPLSLYHAATFGGSAEAVRLLALAGVPAAAADSVCNGTEVADLLGTQETPAGQLLSNFQGTALGWAALLGDSTMMEALLRAGAAVDTRLPQVPCVLCRHDFLRGTQYQPATPLDIVASRAAGLGEQRTVSLLRFLLQSGASVTSLNRQVLVDCCASQGAALLLLQHLQQASEQGRLHIDAEAECTWYPLLRAAVECDSPDHLDYFLGRVLQLPLPAYTLVSTLPKAMLRSAADDGSLKVLQLAADAAAAQAAAGGTAGEGSGLGRTLGPHFAAELPWLLVTAAKEDQAAAVRLLLDAGAVPSARAVKEAALAGAVGALRALLSRGPPSFDEPLPQPFELPSHRASDYPCPILATLHHRLHRAAGLPLVEALVHLSHCADAVHHQDVRLLVVVEVLREFGYRPRKFQNVTVSTITWDEDEDEEQQKQELWQHFDPLVQDKGLEGEGINRWLRLAAEHPDWSPASHGRFLPSFRSAARTLLLLVRRGSSLAVGSSAGKGASERSVGSLSTGSGEASAVEATSSATSTADEQPLSWPALPPELLLHIVGLAAYPLSAWAPLDAAATQAVINENSRREQEP